MTHHVLDPTIAYPLATPNLRLRHLVEFGLALVGAGVILAVAFTISGGSDDTRSAVPADALRWQAIVASEFPAPTPAAPSDGIWLQDGAGGDPMPVGTPDAYYLVAMGDMTLTMTQGWVG